MTPETAPVYALKDVSFSHGPQNILSAITLDLEPGRFYGLIGPNGSGKTTLLDLLANHQQPESGTIHFCGVPLAAYSNLALARQVALVPQEFSLDFDFTVFDLVMMGRHPHIPRFSRPTATDLERVDQALEQMDIRPLQDRLVTKLSGGEKQRVIVARALAQETGVLILDEATSSLDIHHTLRIMHVLRQKTDQHNMTVIAAIHDLNLAASFCDELIVLKDRGLYARGPVGQLVNRDLIRDVFAVETRIVHDPTENGPHIFFHLNE